MDNNGIILRKAVLHVLDNGYRGLIHPLDLVGEQFDFLRNILQKVHKSDSTMYGQFNPETSYIYQLLSELNENDMESFVDTSKKTAQALFNVVIKREDIPSGDLVCTSFQESGTIYLALLKLNYRSSYTQKISKDQDGTATKLIENISLLPSASTKPSEAAIINLTDKSIRLIEKNTALMVKRKTIFQNYFLAARCQAHPKRNWIS